MSKKYLSAIRPASVQMALMSAPERSSLAMMYSSTLTSSARVIYEKEVDPVKEVHCTRKDSWLRTLLVWMLKILLLVFSSGKGNSILRSILPGRMRAARKENTFFLKK